MTSAIIDLWLDDIRPPEVHAPLREPVLWVKTADEAIAVLERHQREPCIRWASLDHDLADSHYHTVADRAAARAAEKTGYTVCLWMAEHDVWPMEGIIVHSWSPAGAQNMCGTIERYASYAPIRRPARFFPVVPAEHRNL